MAAIFPGFSEFGRALAEFLAHEQDARGGVLSDAEGDAVDFAYAPARMSELEVQLLGAQLDRSAAGVSAYFAARGHGACEILIEASHGRLCAAFVARAYVLAVLLDPRGGDDRARSTEAERLLASFRALRRRVEALLLGQ